MKKKYPDFDDHKIEKINMFEDVELPDELKGLVINSIKKEKRRKNYKIASIAAAILLVIVAPSYFYLNFNSNSKESVSLNKINVNEGITALNGKNANEKRDINKETVKGIKAGALETTNKYDKVNKSENNTTLENKTTNHMEIAKNKTIGKIIHDNNKQTSNNNKINENNKDSKNLKDTNLKDTKLKDTKVKDQQVKGNIYSKQVAINQSSDKKVKESNETSITGTTAKVLKTSKNVGDSIDKSNDNVLDKVANTDNSQDSATINGKEFAIANNGANIDDSNKTSVDGGNAQDKIKQQLRCQRLAGDIENTVNVNLNSNMTILELENILNELNLKDYTVKDNIIEVNCKVIDYKNLKDYLDKTYQNKINYTEPENINQKQDSDVKLVIQI